MTNQHAPDDLSKNKASAGNSSSHDYGGLTPELADTDLAVAQDIGADPPGGIVFGLPEDSTTGESGREDSA